MSLRLLQKQVGVTAGGASPAGARPNTWLGSKSAPKARAYQGKGGGTGSGRGGGVYQGKGKGRGSSAFLEGIGEDVPQEDECSESPARDLAPSFPAGLEGVLGAASLTQHLESAKDWCQKEGCGYLDEVLDFFEDFAAALGLKPLEKKRLLSKLQAAAAAAASGEPLPEVVEDTSARAPTQQLVDIPGLDSTFEKAALSEKLQEAKTWCGQAGLRSLGEISGRLEDFVTSLGLKPLEQKRLKKQFQDIPAEEPTLPAATEARTVGVPQPVLEGIFNEAQLDAQSAATATKWTEDQKLSTVGQMLDSIDDLVSQLNLKPLEVKRLKKVLNKAAADEQPPTEAASEVAANSSATAKAPKAEPPASTDLSGPDTASTKAGEKDSKLANAQIALLEAKLQQQRQQAATAKEEKLMLTTKRLAELEARLVAMESESEDAAKDAAAKEADAAVKIAEFELQVQQQEHAESVVQNQAEEAESCASELKTRLQAQESKAASTEAQSESRIAELETHVQEQIAKEAAARADVEDASKQIAELRRSLEAQVEMAETAKKVAAANEVAGAEKISELKDYLEKESQRHSVELEAQLQTNKDETAEVARWRYAQEEEQAKKNAEQAKATELAEILERLEQNSAEEYRRVQSGQTEAEERASELREELTRLRSTYEEEVQLRQAAITGAAEESKRLENEVAEWREAHASESESATTASKNAREQLSELSSSLSHVQTTLEKEAMRGNTAEESLQLRLEELQQLRVSVTDIQEKGAEERKRLRDAFASLESASAEQKGQSDASLSMVQEEASTLLGECKSSQEALEASRKEIDVLRQQAAETRVALTEELCSAQSDAESQVARLKESLETSDKQHADELVAKDIEAERVKQELADDYTDKMEHLKQSHADEVARRDEDLKKLDGDAANLGSNVEQLRSELASEVQRTEQLTSSEVAAQAEIAEITERVNQLEAKLDNTQQELQNTETSAATNKNDADDRIAELEKQTRQLQSECVEANDELISKDVDTERMKQTLAQEHSQAMEALREANAEEVARRDADFAKASGNASQLASDIENLRTELASELQRSDELKSSEIAAQKEVGETSDRVQQLEAKCDRLNQDFEHAENEAMEKLRVKDDDHERLKQTLEEDHKNAVQKLQQAHAEEAAHRDADFAKASGNAAELANDMVSLRSELAEEVKRLETAQAELQEAEKAHASTTEDLRKDAATKEAELRQKISDLQTQLEQLRSSEIGAQGTIAETLTRVRELEAALESSKKDSELASDEAAEAYEALTKELSSTKSHAENRISELQESSEICDKQHADELVAKDIEAERLKQELNSEYTEHLERLKHSHAEEVARRDEDVKKLGGDAADLGSNIEQLRSELASEVQRSEQLKSSEIAAQGEVAETAEKVSQLEAKLESTQQELQNTETEAASNKSATNERITDLEKQTEQLQVECAEAQDLLIAKDVDAERMKQGLEQEHSQAMATLREAHVEEVARRDADFAKASGDASELASDIENLRTELAKEVQRCDELKSSEVAAQNEAAETSDKVKHLEAQLERVNRDFEQSENEAKEKLSVTESDHEKMKLSLEEDHKQAIEKLQQTYAEEVASRDADFAKASGNAAELANDMVLLRGELAEEAKRFEAAQADMQEAEKAHASTSEETRRAAASKESELGEKISDLESQVQQSRSSETVVQGELAETRTQVEQVNATLESVRKELELAKDEASTSQSTSEANITDLEKQVVHQKEEHATAQRDADEQRQRCLALQADIDTREKTAQELQENAEEAAKEAAEKQAASAERIAGMGENITELSAQLQQSQSEHAIAQKETQAVEEKLKLAEQSAVEKMEAAEQAAEKAAEKAKKREAELEAKLETLKQKADEAAKDAAEKEAEATENIADLKKQLNQHKSAEAINKSEAEEALRRNAELDRELKEIQMQRVKELEAQLQGVSPDELGELDPEIAEIMSKVKSEPEIPPATTPAVKPLPPAAPEEAGLSELIVALADTGLAHFAEAAQKWCQDQGAELLDEVVEFFDDFVEGIGLSVEERLKLAGRLKIEDEEFAKAKRIVDETEEEIKRVNEEAKKAGKKQKSPLLARIKELETSAAYLDAKAFVENPAAAREKLREEAIKQAEAKVRTAIKDRDIASATDALAAFRAAGGASTALSAEVAALRTELAAERGEADDEQRRRMLQRKATKEMKGFCFDPPTSAELDPPKKLSLKVDPEIGIDFLAQPSWYGMVVEEVDEDSGMPELKAGDCIISIGGNPLVELEDCEGTFSEFLADGVEIEVEPHCVVSGALPRGASVDWDALEGDLACFAEDYQVEVKITPDKRSAQLVGPRSAVAAAREGATDLLGTYFPG